MSSYTTTHSFSTMAAAGQSQQSKYFPELVTQWLTMDLVDLTTLSSQQLSQVKKQLDEEVQHLTNSYQNLRTAQQKFRDCIVSIKNGVANSVKGREENSIFNAICS